MAVFFLLTLNKLNIGRKIQYYLFQEDIYNGIKVPREMQRSIMEVCSLKMVQMVATL